MLTRCHSIQTMMLVSLLVASLGLIGGNALAQGDGNCESPSQCPTWAVWPGRSAVIRWQ